MHQAQTLGRGHAPDEERRVRIKALIADHSGFRLERLTTLVGRTGEIQETRRLIEARFTTGGYVTVTGRAGQGKSSLIARLVEEFGASEVAHYFIPFNPGPDHQVRLLRSLMAHLVLKYELPDFYLASESRTVLAAYFIKVLKDSGFDTSVIPPEVQF